jgi:voltage-gated potassium channel Kch
MAWQVLLVRLPGSLRALGELPPEWAPPALGDPTDVAGRIASVSHEVRLDGDGERLVVLRCDDFVIEAELGGVAAIDRVLLRVLGSDAALPLVGALARALDTAAVDCETDAVLDTDAIVPDTLRQWQIRIEELR